MLYSYTAALLASATVALAAPHELIGRATFQIDQVAKGQVFKNGPVQMMKAYNKYAHVGATAPTEIAAAAAAAQTGSATTTPEQYDEAYLTPVKVGGQTLMLDFDTGSSDLWVFSTLQSSSQTSGHSVYNPETSGQELQGETWDISYGDGSGASGVVYADKVVVGGVTATTQAVEAATSISSSFAQDTDNDGLLGLAFSSINTVQPDQQTTFFDTVKDTLAKPLFAANLKKGEAGSYDFGYIDSSKYTGSITYTSVDSSQGFWSFTAGGYSVGSGNSTSGSIGSSIADTGTSLMYLPTSVVKAYYAKVSGSQNSNTYGGYVYPCSATLPDFHVTIAGSTYTIPGDYINYAPANQAGTTCFGGIQPNTGIGFTIFGDIFLKAMYVVFDQTTDSPRLGFAQSPDV